MRVHAHPCRGQKKALEALELGLQVVVRYPRWVLRT